MLESNAICIHRPRSGWKNGSGGFGPGGGAFASAARGRGVSSAAARAMDEPPKSSS